MTLSNEYLTYTTTVWCAVIICAWKAVLSPILAKNICGEGRAVRMWSTGRCPCARHHMAPVFFAFLMAIVGATLPKKPGSCCHRYLLTAYLKSVTACKMAMGRIAFGNRRF